MSVAYPSMASNPVERNVVSRTVLGLVVVALMFVGGMAVGSTFVPELQAFGVLLGSLAVFAGFAVLYRRYDESFEPL